jgi:hypothetical protein
VARDVKAYKLAVLAAWAVSPGLSISLHSRFTTSADLDGKRKGISALCSLVYENPGACVRECVLE